MGKTPPPTSVTKQYDGKVPVMQERWGMRIISSSPSLPGPLWPELVAPDKDLFNGLKRTELRTYAK